MKRWIAISLFFAIFLSGCGLSGRNEDRIPFFYSRKTFDHYGDDPVILSEMREAAGHQQDLQYLISLYLMGPTLDTLSSPFPAGTRLVSVSRDEQGLVITLTDNLSVMSDVAFSLSCTCLGKTVLEITQEGCVTIISGNRSAAIRQDSLLLEDALLDQNSEGENS